MGNRVFKTPIELPGGIVLPDDLGGGDASVHAGDDPPAGTPTHGALWIDTDDEVAPPHAGSPVATYSWNGGGTNGIDAVDHASRETLMEQVIPSTANRSVEAVFDCTGYAYMSAGSSGTAVLQLEYSEDGGSTWVDVNSSRALVDNIAGQGFSLFGLHARYAGTPTNDLRVRLTGYSYSGSTLIFHGSNSELVAQIFFGGPVLLDNRYVKQPEGAASLEPMHYISLATQDITSASTWQKLIWNSSPSRDGGWGGGSDFVAPATGYYLFTILLVLTGGTFSRGIVTVSNSHSPSPSGNYARFDGGSSPTANFWRSVSGGGHFNAGDPMNVYVWCNSSGISVNGYTTMTISRVV